MELVLDSVTKNFGGLRAVGDVSFSVKNDVIFGLIGPNGAGKTTVFNLITGVYKHDEGRITFGDKNLAPLKPAQIAGVGIGRTFQNIRLFGQLTVIENLLVACELQKKAGLLSAVLRLPVHYDDEQVMHDRALELLRVFDLHTMADEAPTSLSYGNQRRLEIARAMMLEPKLLLLDEPAAGMNYGEAEGLKTQIRWLRDEFHLAVVLVEHNMQVVMGVCEEIHVLDHGETIAHGSAEEIRKHPKVLAAYLGEQDEDAPAVRAAVEEASMPDLSDRIGPPSQPDLGGGGGAGVPTPSSSRRIVTKQISEPALPNLATPQEFEFAAIPTPVSAAPISSPVSAPPSDPNPISNRLSDADMDDISKGLVADLERGLSSSELSSEISLAKKREPAAPAPAPAPPPPPPPPPPEPEIVPMSPPVVSAMAPAPSTAPASPKVDSQPGFTMNEAPTRPKLGAPAGPFAPAKDLEDPTAPEVTTTKLTKNELADATKPTSMPKQPISRPALRKIETPKHGTPKQQPLDDRAVLKPDPEPESPEAALESLEAKTRPALRKMELPPTTPAAFPVVDLAALRRSQPKTDVAAAVPNKPPPLPQSRPKLPAAKKEQLSNVDSGWGSGGSDGRLPAAKPVVESAPDVTKLDTGWGSEKGPAAKTDPDPNEEKKKES